MLWEWVSEPLVCVLGKVNATFFIVVFKCYVDLPIHTLVSYIRTSVSSLFIQGYLYGTIFRGSSQRQELYGNEVIESYWL